MLNEMMKVLAEAHEKGRTPLDWWMTAEAYGRLREETGSDSMQLCGLPISIKPGMSELIDGWGLHTQG